MKKKDYFCIEYNSHKKNKVYDYEKNDVLSLDADMWSNDGISPEPCTDKVCGFKQKIWICPVTLFVLGNYPAYIYLKKTV